jgi:hypothetical protein
MDEKYIWPLIGVALGWLLTLIAANLKDRADNKRKIGNLLAKLIIIQDQVSTMIVVAEQVKDGANGWEDYENLRKSITDRHFLEPSSHIDSLRSAIDDVSGLYPLEALHLHRLVDMLLKNKNASLSTMSKYPELYIRAISAYEVALDACKAALEKGIRNLAAKHSLITYARVLKKSWLRAHRHQKIDAFTSKFSGELWADFKRLSEHEESLQSPTDQATTSSKSKAAPHVEG